jgi:hypothetical protein
MKSVLVAACLSPVAGETGCLAHQKHVERARFGITHHPLELRALGGIRSTHEVGVGERLALRPHHEGEPPTASELDLISELDHRSTVLALLYRRLTDQSASPQPCEFLKASGKMAAADHDAASTLRESSLIGTSSLLAVDLAPELRETLLSFAIC